MRGLLGVHHVAIIASDYGRSKRFYVEILGAEIVSETYREARRSHKLNLRLPDGVEIELFDFPEAPPRPSYPEARGLRHLALRASDLDVALAHLRTHGIRHEEPRTDELTLARFVFFEDPDGLPIELVETVDS